VYTAAARQSPIERRRGRQQLGCSAMESEGISSSRRSCTRQQNALAVSPSVSHAGTVLLLPLMLLLLLLQ